MEGIALEEYVNWDLAMPGISFDIKTGRIRLFKKTLEVMEYPDYFRFRFSPEDQVFGVEPCALEDGGAYRLPAELPREHFEIKCLNLVRFVYRTCGWRKPLTYRIPGELLTPSGRLVYFDLRQAFEIHEGRMKEASAE